jgi:hypothetical protein
MKKILTIQKKIALLLLTSFSILFIISCETGKDLSPTTNFQEQKTTEKVSISDGILQFATQKDFNDVIKMLSNNQKDLDKWEKQWQNDDFISMRTAFNNINANDIEKVSKNHNLPEYSSFVVIELDVTRDKEAVRVIGDPIVATMVNKDGLVKVGNNMHKYYRDKEVIIKDYNKNKISYLESFDIKEDKEKGIEVGKITRKAKLIEQTKGGRIAYFPADLHCTNYFENNRRMAGVHEYEHTGLGQRHSYKIITKNQKRLFGIWWANEAEWVELKGTWAVSDGQYYHVDHRAYNTNWLESSVTVTCSTDGRGITTCDASVDLVNSEHRVKDEGTERSCNLSN